MNINEDVDLNLPPGNKDIQKRQHYYFLGQEREISKDYQNAIDAYKEYSTWLKAEDRHIPHQWIAKLFFELEQVEEGLLHLEEFAQECSPPKAAIVYKEAGEQYEQIGNFRKALSCYQKAIEANPQIGLKKKIQELMER